MPKARKLSNSEIQEALNELDGWSVQNGKFHRELKFKNFSEAWAFMTRAAMEAHAMDHHPEWSNVWTNVTIDLVTHSVDGLSDLDVEMAKRINQLL